MTLPRCGFYRTTQTIAGIAPDRFVYFHNHGDPGPGIYLPLDWKQNRAVFAERGANITDQAILETLDPLAPEGLYRVEKEFPCCAKRCRVYRVGHLVQLGYNVSAKPILFVPEWGNEGLRFPSQGHAVDGFQLVRLSRLIVDESECS